MLSIVALFITMDKAPVTRRRANQVPPAAQKFPPNFNIPQVPTIPDHILNKHSNEVRHLTEVPITNQGTEYASEEEQSTWRADALVHEKSEDKRSSADSDASVRSSSTSEEFDNTSSWAAPRAPNLEDVPAKVATLKKDKVAIAQSIMDEIDALPNETEDEKAISQGATEAMLASLESCGDELAEAKLALEELKK